MKHNDIFSIGDEQNRHISRRQYRVAWVENSYIPTRDSDTYLTSNFDVRRLRWVFIGILIFFGILLFRTAYLQIISGGDFRAAAEDNRIRIHEVKAPRGILYDRHGTILARNVANFTLSVTTADFPEDLTTRAAIINKLSTKIGIDESELSDKINALEPYLFEPRVIVEHIPYDTALLLQIESASLPGITIQADTFREYTGGEYFSHNLGYLSKISETQLTEHPEYLYDDVIGASGIEQFYESTLRGTYGKKEVEVDSLGKEIKVLSEQLPSPGKNIILTIDAELQKTLGEALSEYMSSHKNVTGGAAVAIDPKTGGIRALVSVPTYDNNEFNKGISADRYAELIANDKRPLFNRPVSGEYPSGSTIKPLIALAGLEEGIITPQTTVSSTGGIRIGEWFFPDWKAGGHGQTNLAKAIAESVNTYFYLVGGGDETHTGLGVDKIRSYLEKFGLNTLLGIDVPGESDGFLPTKEWKEETKGERWYIGDTYHLSIGQGDLLVTPLQVANYIAMIANGGTVFQPRLADSFSSPDGLNVQPVEPKIIRDHVASEKNLKAVQNALREAVLSGSARRLQELPVAAGGKTGTAQFGADNKTHSWFTAYAPFDNPEIAIAVIVEAGGEGNDAALPVALKGLQYWFRDVPRPQ
ncbi:MAG: penicillin-binding protein 2 [Candidatus Kerfeldbacteria bacterium]|nr:penicillin-binding protein 2 [Candidatus Kerfeldbacteria bacterium]